MEQKLGIIGGSGVYDLESIEVIASHDIETPFGKPSAPIMEGKLDGNTFFFVPRHGIGHHISPSEINYRANIFALKKLGVNVVVSITAVGSLKEELPPRKVVLPDQFIDWTKGGRERTFFTEDCVGHVSCAYPIEKNLHKRLQEICAEEGIDHSVGGSYLCIEGPQFSTRAESELYRSFGATVIGMTNVPESFLAKEAGMAYATVALVTDYDCWKEEHCTVEEIMKVMKDNYGTAIKIFKKIIPSLANNPIKFEKENQYAVVTNPEKISQKSKDIIDILMR